MGSADATAGLILCGGRASRMGGGDKCLLPLGQQTILDAIVERAAPQVGSLAISANGDPARLARFDLPVLPDPVAGDAGALAGPLAGILAGVQWAATIDGCTGLASFAGDTPFFPRNLVARLKAATASAPDSIAVAQSVGRNHPTIALWPVQIGESLRRFLGEENSRSIRAFLACHAVVTVPFSAETLHRTEYDPFFNINTPDDLAEAAHIAREIDA